MNSPLTPTIPPGGDSDHTCSEQPTPRLTAREHECLSWVANGKTAWEIAHILSISEATVTFHIENAKKKLDARTLPQAVARAVGMGLVVPL